MCIIDVCVCVDVEGGGMEGKEQSILEIIALDTM